MICRIFVADQTGAIRRDFEDGFAFWAQQMAKARLARLRHARRVAHAYVVLRGMPAPTAAAR